jgi:uncharacterized metal-binding protein YceD (DUF177 family)
MDEAFKIYIDRLKGGTTEKIHEVYSSSFLDVIEPDLKFGPEVTVTGEGYLADDSLILHLDIHAIAQLKCKICNAPVAVDVNISGFYHMEPLAEVKNGVFCFQNVLREAILLETPAFAECNNGQCAERGTMRKYLKNDSDEASTTGSEGDYHPFANIDLDKFKPTK